MTKVFKDIPFIYTVVYKFFCYSIYPSKMADVKDSSILSFAKYGRFIYTKRPVVDANALRKPICAVCSFKQTFDREK